MSELKTQVGPEIELLRIPRKENRGAPKRKRRGFGWLLLLLLLGAGVYLGWNRAAPLVAKWRAPAVKVGAVTKTRPGASDELTTASGYVVARTKAAVSSKLAGRLIDLRVDVGSRARKGDLIGKIEDDVYRAAFEQAEAEVAQMKAEELAASARVSIAERSVAKALIGKDEMQAAINQWKVELAEANRVVVREEDLLKREAGTPDSVAQARYKRNLIQASLERTEAQLRTTDAAVKEAEAEVDGQKARVAVAKESTKRTEAMLSAARSNLADTELRAPFDGVVLRKEADVGEMVVPALMGGGSTRGSVVTLADFSSLEMEVDVFERDLQLIKEGGPARIILDAYKDEPMDGVVRQVEPTADRVKSTVLVKIAFATLDARILPEMGGRVVFRRPGTQTAPTPEVIAPPGAVITREGTAGVYLVEEDRVRFAKVTPGASRPNGTVIESGLRGGELVVIEGSTRISDGATIRVE